MSAAKRRNGGPGDPKKKNRVKSGGSGKGRKMTRKEAKSLKKDMKKRGHGLGKQSTRKIKKYGVKSSF
jgi:hypothetical protein